MSWLSSVRKGIQSLTKRQSADNLWHKCKKCGSMVFTKEWEDNLYVCPRCDHHDRVGPTVRFDGLFDRKKYEVLDSPEVREDPRGHAWPEDRLACDHAMHRPHDVVLFGVLALFTFGIAFWLFSKMPPEEQTQVAVRGAGDSKPSDKP